MNTLGKYFRLTSYGESHGVAVGGVIDGCPAGLELDVERIQYELSRRRPGQSKLTTPRDEKDRIEILSGIFDGKTTGTPIGFAIFNENQQSKDYGNLQNVYRPSHADFTYTNKYGIRDHRGGGRSSARETIARVAAGAVAKQLIEKSGVKVYAYVSQVGKVRLEKDYSELDLTGIDKNDVRCPDAECAQLMEKEILAVAADGDTVGGVITGVITGVPVGLGQPVFNKLHADLGHAMLGINAVKGFEYGSGFSCASERGSEHNDEFIQTAEGVKTTTNRSGGIQGGISNGMDIYFRVAFKPIATIFKDQQTVDREGNSVIVNPKGRHDACVLPRAVPIVEAMGALVIADHILADRLTQL